MSDQPGTSGDRDLLARLNALKKSTIDLDQKTFFASHVPPSESAIDPHPARSLHSDLLDRFKSLSGKASAARDANLGPRAEGIDACEDDKTVEELLADLGPAEQWDVGRPEQDQVEELLHSAAVALANGPSLEQVPDEDADTSRSTTAAVPFVDVAVFEPEPDSDEEDTQPVGKAATQFAVNREADDVLKSLLDEVKLETAQDSRQDGGDAGDEDPPPYEARPSNSTARTEDAPYDLPSAPSNLPNFSQVQVAKDDDDDALAARFAGLSHPSVQTTVQPKAKTYGKPGKGYTEDEIESWCIICSDDATLSCIGCDGDLYCTNCWVEGHRGEDAGLEEKTHKAVQYVKGKKKMQKRSEKRVMMGA